MDDAKELWTAEFAKLAGLLGGICTVLRFNQLATDAEIDGLFEAVEKLATREFDGELVRAAKRGAYGLPAAAIFA